MACGKVDCMRKVVLVVIFLLLATQSVEAKLLPQAKQGGTNVRLSTSSGVTIFPKLRADRRAVIVNFANLKNASSVTYTLTYTTGGQQEGAGGTISLLENTAIREVLFGTCSAGVCRYHTNITNAKLGITANLKSGKKSIKSYRIRV